MPKSRSLSALTLWMCCIGKLGFVKLAGKNSETVPAGHAVALEGSVHVGSSLVEKWAVVEHPTSPSLPGGLLVANCLVTLPAKRLGTLAVVVKNETEHVIIPPKNSDSRTQCYSTCDAT